MCINDITTEIIALQQQIQEAEEQSLQKALRIGELLSYIKENVPHGEFGNVVQQMNMQVRTAQRYKELYAHKDALIANTTAMSHLGLQEAYKIVDKEKKKQKATNNKPSASKKITVATATIKELTVFQATEQKVFVGFEMAAEELEYFLQFIKDKSFKRTLEDRVKKFYEQNRLLITNKN